MTQQRTVLVGKPSAMDMWWFFWRHWTKEDQDIAARFVGSLIYSTLQDQRDFDVMRLRMRP